MLRYTYVVTVDSEDADEFTGMVEDLRDAGADIDWDLTDAEVS